MMAIPQPVNNHLLIEPVKHEEFIASQRDTFQEIGIVVAVAHELEERKVIVKGLAGQTHGKTIPAKVTPGQRVYFDSWLAKKYPKEGGGPDEFYWFVKWDDVTAVAYAESTISE